MRKEVPRDSAPNRTSRAVNKPSPSSGKGQKRAAAAAPSVGKSIKKKKPSTKSSEGESSKSSSGQNQQSDPKGKKKLLKPKVVLTKLNPGNLHQLAKVKPAKEAKKETCPKQVKSKPKKVIVSKPTKKIIKVENDSKRATAAKIVRAVKDVKKARSVVASKIAKTVPKKLSDSGNVRKISSSGINVVKKHNIVKSVNKMSGKKPCVVSVKISNAHSTVTLSVKQNKQIAKKDSTKSSKSSGGRITDRSTISIVKKGIASRRKSASKDCTSQESTPSQSPTRDTSPVRSKETKSSTKTKSVRSENNKPQKKLVKQSSLENKKVTEEKGKDKQCESLQELEEHNQSDKTEVIINDTLKIKTENVGEDQNMEIEFTNSSEKDHSEDKDTKDNLSVHKDDVAKDLKSKADEHLMETKAKSPLNDYSNLKSIDSTTSDEIPLEDLKLKQKIKQEKDSECASQESTLSEKHKKGKESPVSDATENIPLSEREEVNLGPSINLEKKKSEVEKTVKSVRMSKTALKKVVDQESVAKLKISAKSKEKLKDLAVKQKVAKLVRKSRLTEQKQKKVLVKEDSDKDPDGDSDQSRKRLKLYKFWNGPKRHRVASLNAIAKVHCLYENESRGALNDVISSAAALQRAIQESKKMARMESKDRRDKKVVKKQATTVEKKTVEPTNTRNLRTNPGIRSVGRNFDILNVISSTSLSSSSSSEESSDSGEDKKQLVLLPSVKQKQQQIIKEESEQTTDDEAVKKPQPTPNEENKDGVKKVKKRRRKRNELTMDLKDMVVRKRMASLNASAIMTASYSTEKKDKRKDEEQVKEKKERKKKKKPPVSSPAEESSADEDVIVRTTNNKQKVAVIVNQDTDVTITGVYVNSTTRSTHHEGYCSIAGMQYRISSTSHTQTEATAVATETVLHAEHPPCLPDAGPAQTVVTTALSSPCKSYTPLSALSSMQPPGHHHPHPPPCQPPRGPPLSPLQRRHGCSSAFTAPPNYPPPTGPPPPPPPHPDVHGYYQPAGPLISTHHHHHHSTSASVTAKLPPPPTPSSLPTPTPPPSSATHPPSESSDSEVVLTTSSDNPPPVTYRGYPPHGGQPYNYYQYYPSPPASSLQYPGQQSHYHQDICYSPSGYPPGYFPKGHYPPPAPAGYPRRYGPGPHQYYPPQDFYPNPPPNPNSNPPPSSNSQQMIVTASPAGGQTSSAYPPSDSSYPPPAPIVDPYPPPPPQSYYTGYSAGPPPPCYSTHSPSSRGLFIDAAYQGCPCPMQSCPKNVHTGPLTGASKGSMKNHQSAPLPPVALALPLEPPGALGPPSPARGSAGMPPPPSPALATARNPPQSPPVKPSLEQTGLLTISKMVTNAVLLADQVDTNIAELIPKTEQIKMEIEDIVKIEAAEDIKCNRKRRKVIKNSADVKRQAFDVPSEPETKVNLELQERLITPKEEPEKTLPDIERPPLEKQLPLTDNCATTPVNKNNTTMPVLNGNISKARPKKRKTELSSECEPATKVAKCVKSPKVSKNKCVRRKKCVAEENIAPDTEVGGVEPEKVVCRRNSKPMERRKSSSSPHVAVVPPEVESSQDASSVAEVGKKKKTARTKKVQVKTKADHLLRSHGKADLPAPPITKERRLSKGSRKAEASSAVVAPKKAPPPVVVDPSAESQICLPGLRRSLTPRWSNGWSWEGTPYRAKVFLNIDDGAVVRTCYPAMRHVQGDVICPRDCILLKSGPRKIDLPFVAKVAAMWENPEDGEMMVSLLWYYRPEHTERGRQEWDPPDEIFASRHKDTNSVACIEDKCFVLTLNEYSRYRTALQVQDEGLSPRQVVPPLPEGVTYPRSHRQPPGRVAPDIVFFCRRVYDFRTKKILKNPTSSFG
ncbi:uncharacterized protein LOC124357748 isoform X2 [Homalodisca vitripennis]|uniref:uncharacterized protein LOC124357748 isoform X2 n=1 Tax=Homalodisca vitripennis TaxID=197043 RepID=UPI001EEC07D3|nr:uncharacterized protein LOC124357748 isoform X2 [Homalodisca vitripennis]